MTLLHVEGSRATGKKVISNCSTERRFLVELYPEGMRIDGNLRPAAIAKKIALTKLALMQSKATTVPQYLAELPNERRAAIESVRAVILKNLDPVFEEGMQYGMIGYYVPHRVYPAGYHCDPKQSLPFACLASQKNYMSVYLGCVYGHEENERWFRQAWAKTGKKLDMGKSCIRFKKLDDLALDVIGESIRRISAREFIRHYESFLKTARKKSSKKTTKPEPAKRKGAK